MTARSPCTAYSRGWKEALYIGFARRFAPYKRAHLLFQDAERLRALLDSEERPVRILIAGKAHPRDQKGRDILQEIYERSREGDLIGKVIFLENYDMGIARSLVQGVDVWLNTPTRMLEASGTSGMKAAANGGLNLSIGDGWWPEAYDGKNGWMIAGSRVYEDQDLQDQYDSAVLYRLLEEEIAPLYFKRDRGGTPRGWMERVAHDLATIPPVFNTNRMVREYFDRAYGPLGRNYYQYVQDRKAKPKHLGLEAQRIRRGFGEIKVLGAHLADLAEIRVGEPIHVRMDVDLGSLAPEDVRVEFLVGRAHGEGLRDAVLLPLAPNTGASQNGTTVFEGTTQMEDSGRCAYGLRIRARHGSESADLDASGHDDGGGALRDLVLWA